VDALLTLHKEAERRRKERKERKQQQAAAEQGPAPEADAALYGRGGMVVAVDLGHRQIPAAGQWSRYCPNAPG
jgi:hypothetical protein